VLCFRAQSLSICLEVPESVCWRAERCRVNREKFPRHACLLGWATNVFAKRYECMGEFEVRPGRTEAELSPPPVGLGLFGPALADGCGCPPKSRPPPPSSSPAQLSALPLCLLSLLLSLLLSNLISSSLFSSPPPNHSELSIIPFPVYPFGCKFGPEI